jgi:hypothetical protein
MLLLIWIIILLLCCYSLFRKRISAEEKLQFERLMEMARLASIQDEVNAMN